MKIRTINAALLCLSTLCTGNLFAAENELDRLVAGYDLTPHKQEIFKGNFFSTRNLSCHVRSKGTDTNPLSIVAVKKRVIVNGIILSEGNAMSILTNIGDTIRLEIDTRGKLGVTNEGDKLVNLRCK